MEKDLISVLILTYRNFDGIYETLDSVFAQDHPAIEIIISDDGSKNASEVFPQIESYIETHRSDSIRNVVLHTMEHNVGTVKNSNYALKCSNGEYIINMAAEDTLNAPDVLSRFRRYLDESGCLLGVCKVRGVDPQGNYHFHLASCEDDYDTLRSYTPDQLLNRLYVRNCLPAPAFFFKRELFERYGYYPEDTRLIEDYPYWMYLCQQQVRFAFFDDRMIDYKLTGVSSAGHYSRMFMDDMLVIYNKYIFPHDRRFGIAQPVYNALKQGGLNAYIALADWEDYSAAQKITASLKYFPFFAYIKLDALRHRG